MMLSTTFAFVLCTVIYAVNSDPSDGIEGAGMMVVRKTVITNELANNKTVVLVTLQQKAVELQVLPPPKDESEERKDEIDNKNSPLGPNVLFGWQDLTRFNDAKRREEFNASNGLY